MKKELCQYPTQAKDVWEVWDRVAKVWGKIEPEVCQKLIESMPRRIEGVIKAKGVIPNTKTIFTIFLKHTHIIVPMSVSFELHISPWLLI